jgi:hypothetical protein
MLRALLVAASVTLVSPAIAAECRPAEPVVGALQRMKAIQMTYDGDAVGRAEQIYAAIPPAGAVSGADHVIVAELPAGSLVLLLLQRTSVCATLMIPDPRVAQMAKEFILGIAT